MARLIWKNNYKVETKKPVWLTGFLLCVIYLSCVNQVEDKVLKCYIYRILV